MGDTVARSDYDLLPRNKEHPDTASWTHAHRQAERNAAKASILGAVGSA